jgi:hypothetical protein
MWLYLGLGFGVLSVVCSIMSRERNVPNRDRAGLRPKRSSFPFPDYGKREDFTQRGWLWRNLLIVCQILGVAALLVWFLTP